MECLRCHTDKPLTPQFFHRQKGSSTGYRLTCKECRKEDSAAYNKIHAEEIIEKTNHWRKDNPEKARAIGRKSAQTAALKKKAIAQTTEALALKEKRAIEKEEAEQKHLASLTSKICSRCEIEQPFENFYPHKKHKNGYSSICKSCRSIETKLYRETNAEKIRERKHAWQQSESGKASAKQSREKRREEHPEEIREYQRNYRETHKEEINTTKRKHYAKDPSDKERSLQWRREHPEQAKAITKRWYENNTETAMERNRAWQKANPEKVRQIAVVSEAKKRSLKHADTKNDLTTAQWREILAAYQYRCVYCPHDCKACKAKSHQLTQDHITPVAKGGSTTASNIVPACRSCNSKKHTGDVPVPIHPLLLTVTAPKPAPAPAPVPAPATAAGAAPAPVPGAVPHAPS